MKAKSVIISILLLSTAVLSQTIVDHEENHDDPQELKNGNSLKSEVKLFIQDSAEDKGASYQNDEVKEVEMTDEMKERIYGIEVDLCKNYNYGPKSPLHLSHPHDCGKFYKCSNNRAFLQDCAPHTHWSVNLNRCDYISVARCKKDGNYHFKLPKPSTKKAKPVQASAIEEIKTHEKPETGDFEIDSRCEGSIDPYKPLHFKHPHDCSKFYKCYMNRAYVVKCPKGQNWAQNLNRCEHVSVAKCSVLKPSIKPAQLFVEEQGDDYESDEYEEDTYQDELNIYLDSDYRIEDRRCSEIPKDRFHPVQFQHPTNCGMFYKCYDGFGYKARCPSVLFFNEKIGECDYPENVSCKTGGLMKANVVEASYKELKIPQCDSFLNIKFSVEDSFTSYFECYEGVPYLRQCEDHELFNPILRTCEHVTISDSDLVQQLILLKDRYSGNFAQNSYVPPQSNVPNTFDYYYDQSYSNNNYIKTPQWSGYGISSVASDAKIEKSEKDISFPDEPISKKMKKR